MALETDFLLSLCAKDADWLVAVQLTEQHQAIKGKYSVRCRQGSERPGRPMLLHNIIRLCIAKSLGSLDPEDSLLSSFISYYYIRPKGKQSLAQTYVMYNHSFWEIFNYYFSDVVIWLLILMKYCIWSSLILWVFFSGGFWQLWAQSREVLLLLCVIIFSYECLLIVNI